jgi:hypothetical protein
MRTPAGTECPYYYEDYHRGAEVQECRLIAANPRSERWTPDLCGKCPVPQIVRANASPDLRLEAHVARRFGLLRRVEVSAFCLKHAVEVPEPELGCAQCNEERLGSNLEKLFSEPDD